MGCFESHHFGIETKKPDKFARIEGNPLNRTTLELKLLYRRGFPCSRTLWIAPLWNWNFDTLSQVKALKSLWIAPLWNWNIAKAIFKTAQSHFESHHFGIETLNRFDWFNTILNFESHHFGIETYLATVIHNYTFLWIAPLWNWNTAYVTLLEGGVYTLNRTTLELKPRQANGCLQPMKCFESHHFGIETK